MTYQQDDGRVTTAATPEARAAEIERHKARIAELEAEAEGAHMIIASERQEIFKLRACVAERDKRISELEAERDTAWNAALEEAKLNLRAYAPHLVDGPENDVGYYHGYHTAINRIRALMKKEGEDE